MTGDSLFSAGTPRVFTLPPQADFLRTIASTLRHHFDAETNPQAIARLTLLTPTRRAARALGDAFAKAAGNGVAVLPLIRPLGDIDVDDPPFEPGELAGLVPEAISPARRRFELARLILAKETALGRTMDLAGALALADPLAMALDDLATERAGSLAGLADRLAGELPADRLETASFLDILAEAWPARLAELDHIDPADRRNRVLDALRDKWAESPPDTPVLVIGSTGSIPAARELMRDIAHLKHGAVVLPGFDWDSDDRSWSHIDDAHPQWAMRAFVESLGLHRSEIRTWPGASEPDTARARRRLIAEALRPAEATSDWVQRIADIEAGNEPGFLPSGTTGFSLVECPDEINEARVCALALRETLEVPGRTALLVTADRLLADRVSAQMLRYGVVVDNSAGTALNQTDVGQFLLRLLDVIRAPGQVVPLMSLWSSGFFAARCERGPLHSLLGKLEAACLRGPRPGLDLDAVLDRLARSDDLHDADRPMLTTALATLAEAAALLTDQPRSLADWATAHAQAAEVLASDHAVAGAVRLWHGKAGEAACGLMRDILTESDALAPVNFATYAAAFADLAQSRRVPPERGLHPRIQILGPLESRLLTADRIILAGLNEGVWPGSLGADPWLSRGMRDALGLAMPEQRQGLAAHDFAQLAAGSDVLITRSEKRGGSPTVASRWIWRLKTLLRGTLGEQGARDALRPDTDYLSIARAVDRAPDHVRPAQRPEPKPPLALRPRTLSVTEIRTWIRDPYSIYAKHILGLRPLDPPDMAPGPRERGTALHAVLERCYQAWGTRWPEDAAEQLATAGMDALRAAGFDSAALEVEAPRLSQAMTWLARWETARRGRSLLPAAIEAKGEMTLHGPEGPFTLRVQTDRIDRHADGRYEVLDYKTGRPPSTKEVAAGFDPQLPLTAAVLASGGFASLAAGPAAELLYLKLSGGRDGGEEARLSSRTRSAEALTESALEDLHNWIARFDTETTGYASQPRLKYTHDYGQYDLLARRGEWSSAVSEEET